MSASNPTNTLLPPPFFRLPPELRLQIYRHLLLYPRTVRMTWLNHQTTTDSSLPSPFVSSIPWGTITNKNSNHLHPAILRTCRLFHNEATNILYRENVFRAHRIDDSNPHVAQIARAKCVIGVVGSTGVKVDVACLAALLSGRCTGLRHVVVEFGRGLWENNALLRDEIRSILLGSAWYHRSRLAASGKKRRGLNDDYDDCVMREGEEEEGGRDEKVIDSTMCTVGNDFTIEFKKFRNTTETIQFSLHDLTEWGEVKSTPEPEEKEKDKEKEKDDDENTIHSTTGHMRSDPFTAEFKEIQG